MFLPEIKSYMYLRAPAQRHMYMYLHTGKRPVFNLKNIKFLLKPLNFVIFTPFWTLKYPIFLDNILILRLYNVSLEYKKNGFYIDLTKQ